MQQQVNEELKKAMKDGNNNRKTALRSILNEFKNKGQNLNENEAIDVLFKLAKKYNDSIEKYKQGGRDDLVKEEEYELSVVQEFLPEQMSESEVEETVSQIINDLGANSMKDMGNIMQEAQNRIGNQADKKLISHFAKQKLNS